MKIEDILKASDWPDFVAENPPSRRCTLTLELNREQSAAHLEMLFRWICCSTEDPLRLMPKDVTIAPGVVLTDVDTFLSFDTEPIQVVGLTRPAIFVTPEERRSRERVTTHHTCTIEYTQYERPA